jgi:FKBP-type peptidyl-prolyl cis-trans isomerase 2
MALKEGDFIEIDFTGKVKDGEVFDSTKKEELEKLHVGHNHPVFAKPFVFSLGKGMFLNSLDEFLIGKEIGKDYSIELPPEKAFGKRSPELIQTMPMKVFKEKDINPLPGYTLNFDGRAGKILTVSGGRVIVDFNHALSGKPVVYDIKVKRKVEDLNEKVRALNDFFFRKEFNFKIDGKKLIVDVEKPLVKIVELFKDKFKEILDLDLEVKEVEELNK